MAKPLDQVILEYLQECEPEVEPPTLRSGTPTMPPPANYPALIAACAKEPVCLYCGAEMHIAQGLSETSSTPFFACTACNLRE